MGMAKNKKAIISDRFLNIHVSIIYSSVSS